MFVLYVLSYLLQDGGPPKPSRVSGWGEDAPRRRLETRLCPLQTISKFHLHPAHYIVW